MQLVPENKRQRDLVDQAQRGDAEAFAQLVSSRLDRSWRFVRAIGGDRVDVDDVVQEAFVLVWRDLPKLRDLDAFDAWLRAILVHATRHANRGAGRVRLIQLSSDPASDAVDRVRDPHLEPGAALASREAFARAFARLSLDQRTILVLHYVEGHPLEFVADVLRRPLGTVKSRLHGARSALRAAIAAEDR